MLYFHISIMSFNKDSHWHLVYYINFFKYKIVLQALPVSERFNPCMVRFRYVSVIG